MAGRPQRHYTAEELLEILDTGPLAEGEITIYRGTGQRVREHAPVFSERVFGQGVYGEKWKEGETLLERIRRAEFPHRPSRLTSTFWTPGLRTAAIYGTKAGDRATAYVSSRRASLSETFFGDTFLVSDITAGPIPGTSIEDLEDLARRYWGGTDPEDWSDYAEALIPGKVKSAKEAKLSLTWDEGGAFKVKGWGSTSSVKSLKPPIIRKRKRHRELRKFEPGTRQEERFAQSKQSIIAHRTPLGAPEKEAVRLLPESRNVNYLGGRTPVPGSMWKSEAELMNRSGPLKPYSAREANEAIRKALEEQDRARLVAVVEEGPTATRAPERPVARKVDQLLDPSASRLEWKPYMELARREATGARPPPRQTDQTIRRGLEEKARAKRLAAKEELSAVVGDAYEKLPRRPQPPSPPLSPPADDRAAKKLLTEVADKSTLGKAEMKLPAALDDHVSSAVKSVKGKFRLGALAKVAPYAAGALIGADILASREKAGPFWGAAASAGAYFLTRNMQGWGRLGVIAGSYAVGRMIGGSLSKQHSGPLPGLGESGEASVMRKQMTDFGSGYNPGEVARFLRRSGGLSGAPIRSVGQLVAGPPAVSAADLSTWKSALSFGSPVSSPMPEVSQVLTPDAGGAGVGPLRYGTSSQVSSIPLGDGWRLPASAARRLSSGPASRPNIADRALNDFAEAHPSSALYRRGHPRVLEGFKNVGVAGARREGFTGFGTGWDAARDLVNLFFRKGARAGKAGVKTAKQLARERRQFKKMLATEEFQSALGRGKYVEDIGAGGVGKVELMETELPRRILGHSEDFVGPMPGFKYAKKGYKHAELGEIHRDEEMLGLAALQDSISPTPYGKGRAIMGPVGSAGEELPVMYMEYIPGAETLGKRLSTSGGVASEKHVQILRDAATELHTKGLVHTDITHSNVLIDYKDRVVLLDPMPGRGGLQAAAKDTPFSEGMFQIQKQQDLMAVDVIARGGTMKELRLLSDAPGGAFDVRVGINQADISPREVEYLGKLEEIIGSSQEMRNATEAWLGPLDPIATPKLASNPSMGNVKGVTSLGLDSGLQQIAVPPVQVSASKARTLKMENSVHRKNLAEAQLAGINKVEALHESAQKTLAMRWRNPQSRNHRSMSQSVTPATVDLPLGGSFTQ